MLQELGGPFIVLITPLDDQRCQDKDSLKCLIDYYLKAGVTGFTILGESSEVEKLTSKEKSENMDLVLGKINGRVPVVFGTSREGTQNTVAASICAEEKGASALMIAPPKNPKLRDDAIFDHYAAIGDSVKIPIVIQDIPESNHPYMSPQLIARINSDISGAQYLKLEDPPTPMKLTRLRAIAGNRLKIFGALGGKGCLWELDRGSIGIMTASPTPEYLVGLWTAYTTGNRNKALEIYFYNLPLIHFYSEAGLAVRKKLLQHRGIIRTKLVKLPGRELDERGQIELIELLDWVERNVEEKTGLKPLRLPRKHDVLDES